MNQTKMKLETYKRILGKDFKLNNTKIYWVYEDENIRISTKNNDINNIDSMKFTVNKKDSTGKFKTIWKGFIPDGGFLKKIIQLSIVDDIEIISCGKCKFYHYAEVFCTYHNHQFIIPDEKFKPDFCKVKNIIVEEE